MKLKRLIITLLVFIISASLLIGCGKGSNTADKEGSKNTNATTTSTKKKVIGVMIGDMSNQFQSYIMDGMKAEAKKYEDEFEFVFVDGKFDSNVQLSQAENFISQKVNAIVLIPGDKEGSKPIVDRIVKAGIPLIGCNTKVADMEKLTTYVGSDTIQSGELLMQGIADKLGGKGNIVELQGFYGHEPQIERHKGIQNILSKYSNIKVLAENTGKWNRAEGMAVMENWLKSDLKDKINAVVAHNDEMAIGAMKAVEAVGLLDKIIIGGIDATPEMLKYLKEGKVEVTVFQDAVGQGKKAIECAVKAVKGEKLEKEYMIPYELVKPEDADKYLAKYPTK
ncbi:sugar ABC transporter substrate-binding protein [Neomoorella humiferrea]|uniref:D-ribose-binding periplasmic protein n=1 Tax=Neomoorella humiferrea TaxID=676965 RepID=A0A2T0AMP5_9FIRM|nr:sugar ABC transporter substrate-binding protein [Moorella humiferrea]PRR69900.1 D-ribose-binding periplasmic protein precursor [Moorella humiferrea]